MTFTIENFEGSGQYVILNREQHYQDTGYMSTLAYKVCYNHHAKTTDVLLVAMTDGMVEHTFTGSKLQEAKQLLCDHLNSNGYRLLKHEELVRIALYQNLRCGRI